MNNLLGQKCRNILMDIGGDDEKSSKYLIAKRLQQYHVDMEKVFEELENKLSNKRLALKVILERTVDLSSRFNIEEIARKKEIKNQVVDLNRDISKKIEEVLKLLEKKDGLIEYNGLTDNSETNIAALIIDSSQHLPYFTNYLQSQLEQLKGLYWGDKYWPSISNIFAQFSLSLNESNVEYVDPIIESATSKRESKNIRTFVESLFDIINENRVSNTYHPDYIPDDFKLSDRSMATIVNCVLNLEDEKIIDSSFIKNIRHKMK